MTAGEREDYKREQERWVTGHSGSSLADINLVVMTVMVCYLHRRQSLATFGVASRGLVADYALLCIPVVLSMTVLSDRLVLLNTVLLVAWVSLRVRLRGSSQHWPTEEVEVGQKRHTAYLTAYRSMMMLLTCAAILAVDFPAFPRRFAKVETFGTSLMDLGVGAFVFSSGLLSARKHVSSAVPRSRSLVQNFLSNLQVSLPLAILGLARVVAVKGTDYQEHVSEYGVHWNFFLTLASLPPLLSLFEVVVCAVTGRGGNIPRGASGAVGCVVAVVYQTALSLFGLEQWILHAPREGLLSANKEGVCSLVGYLAIYLISQEAGMSVFASTEPKSGNSRRQRAEVGRLVVGTASLWTAFVVTTTWLEVSRRQANLPYVLWISAQNLTYLLGFRAIHAAVPALTPAGDGVPKLLQAVNRNGLLVFLAANLLTGIVNLSMRTLYASDAVAVAVICGYMFLVSVSASALRTRVIRLGSGTQRRINAAKVGEISRQKKDQSN